MKMIKDFLLDHDAKPGFKFFIGRYPYELLFLGNTTIVVKEFDGEELVLSSTLSADNLKLRLDTEEDK